MSYLFNTPDQQAEMLGRIGVGSMAELLAQVPEPLQLGRLLDLPPALTEIELQQHLQAQAARTTGATARACFLGGGAYEHFIPSVVDEITSRGEFYTAYTPYQAEASQGTLQAFYEYQSLICDLTEMPVSNASLYEGGTSVSEAVFMAQRVTGRHDRVVVLGSVHPEYRQVVETYLKPLGCELVTVPVTGGSCDLAAVAAAIDDRTACVVVQQPNFLGALEQVAGICDAARAKGALSVVSFDPLSLGVLKSPGACGADIAVAEGQSLGIPLQFGGPYLGVMTCREDYVRKMPGRLIGVTTDRRGNTCYVLNLQAREQHIRREKATSNICTNQGLMALRATVYLSLLGPHGLREVSELCCRKAHYAAERLAAVPGIRLAMASSFFKEFLLDCEAGAETVAAKARAAGFDVGPVLSRVGTVPGLPPDLADRGLLVAVTELRTRHEIDRLVEALAE